MDLLLLLGDSSPSGRTLGLCRLVQEMATPNVCSVPALEGLPFFSLDLDASKPGAVLHLLERVNACDGIICITSDVCRGMPASLKNGIDWVSRPAFASPLKGKPVTFIADSASPVGGAHVQAELILVFASTLSLIYPCREMLVDDSGARMQAGALELDHVVRGRLARHIEGFLAFVRRHRN